MNKSNEYIFIQGLQDALNKPIQVLGNLRDDLLLLKEEINNDSSLIDLNLRIEELISQAHKKAPQLSKKLIKKILNF